MRPLALLLAAASIAAAADSGPIRVLFIGNSLTAANNLPAMVEAIARANGDRIVVRQMAYPDFSLEDHWQQGSARRAIAEGGWSFVVLQQGPSSLEESRVLLVDYAKRFAAEAKRVGARTALYMVWPESSRAAAFDGVKRSYESAARETGGVFLPAGEAWRIAWARDPKLAFYGPDGFHPTRLGSMLAALVVYEGLVGKPAPRTALTGVSDVEAKALLAAAADALTRR